MARLFSGVKPTSDIPHLGNYIGAFRHWVSLQEEHESFICVVDLHAITVPPWDPATLADRTRQIAASLIALGIDPDRSTLFVQSDVPEHAELSWLLTCIAKMGELGRMTQFKEKSRGDDAAATSTGLFAYPVLMAADVLLYRATLVPVGDDQKQHVELMRDLAQRFNREFGETFPVPEPVVSSEGARIMALDDPGRKMDKSSDRPNNVIWMTDPPDAVRSKISRAVTDSGRDIAYGPEKPAISNLLDIMSAVTNRGVPALEEELSGKGYAEFKQALSDAVIAFLDPFQARYRELSEDRASIDRILDMGAKKAHEQAHETMAVVRERVGLRSSEPAAG